MRLRNSFWAMLGRDTSEASEAVVERIRARMLSAMDDYGLEHASHLDVKISFATDIDALWYLRSDLMNAICATRGESVARAALTEITTMFKGYHASATTSRFASL
jgi:hypothetical protein